MKNYALVKNGIVENVVAWDGVSEYDPGPEYTLVETAEAAIGWTYDGNAFVPPAPPLSPPELTAAEKLAASGLTVDELKQLLGLS